MKLLKTIIFAFSMSVSATAVFSQGAAINTTGSPADPSAILDVSSIDKGALLPRMTEVQRNAIVNPADGLIIYNTDTKCINLFKNGLWHELCGNCIPPVAPVAGSNSPVCSGDTIKLTASTVPNTTYTWTGPNGFSSNLQNPKIPNSTVANAGQYSVSVAAGGCSSNIANVNVTVNQTPVSTFTFTPTIGGINSNVTFTPTVSGASYSWTFQNGTPATSTAQNPVVQWATSGTYNISLTVAQNGCTSVITSNSITITLCNITHGSQTFNYTGAVQTFTVPVCITSITVETWGAQGGNCSQSWFGTGGFGGYATGTLAVSPGQSLNIYVGGQGEGFPTGTGNGGNYRYDMGGWNGGGIGFTAGGGGGASDIRVNGTTLNDRVIVGGGGGGAPLVNNNNGDNGGDGGALIGQAGCNGQNDCSLETGGGGGTQTAGGAAGFSNAGLYATPGQFGIGGDADNCHSDMSYSGGGGGGWYGGGGGGGVICGSGYGAGGGGGSSYIGGVTNGSTTIGVQSGNGKVTITW
ncbi:MAG: glycine-rich protein [Bacteroidota bacterium]